MLLQLTIQHYEQNANAFWEGTRDHDVSQNYAALLKHLPPQKGLEILDLGCGPGRDLKYFKDQGHRPTGLDACGEFCKMAEVFSMSPVLHQDFLNLKLPAEKFDGIFANASLFHVPRQELTRVLKELAESLKPAGILFSSNPRGKGEGWSGDRFGNYMELDVYATYLTAAGFELLEHYYRPRGLPRDEQPWLATISKKTTQYSIAK